MCTTPKPLRMRASPYGRKHMIYITSGDRAKENDYENERLAAILEGSGMQVM